MRRLAAWVTRLLLTFALAASIGATLWSFVQMAQNPALRPVIDRTAAEIAAVTDKMMAREATRDRLAALINTRLAETPRNWVALQALAGLAAERSLPLPAGFAPAYDADHGLMASATTCATCAWNPATCSLSNALFCQGPVAFTPVGDVLGLARGGIDWATGQDMDEIDVALSAVGLSATALVVLSGGSSAAVKVGASTVKLARRMNLVSSRLIGLATDAARTGDFARLSDVALDVNRLRDATSATDALHLLPLIDNAGDARRLARAGEALGPRLVARAEVLGKARLLRATTRITDVALTLFAGFAGLVASLGSLVAASVQSALLRGLRVRV